MFFRELGWLNLNFYNKGYSLTSQSTGWHTGKDAVTLQDSEGRSFLTTEHAPGLEEVLKRELRFPQEYQVIRVQSSQKGLTWLPLYKKGECRFLVELARPAKQAGQVEYLTLGGTLELTVRGFCAYRQFQHEAMKPIKRAILRNVVPPKDTAIRVSDAGAH